MAKLYAIGVGPGDPELLTLKAHRILRQVETVYVPKSRKSNTSVALEIAGEYIPPSTKIEYLYMPMIESREELNRCWEEAARTVLQGLERGDAAFLTLGDPLTYSTATYLVEALWRLDSTAEVVFIPGITSFNACAARLGMPLVEGNETLVVVPSAGTEDYLRKVFTTHDSCILLKVSRAYDTVLKVLEELDLKDRAVFVSRCGSHREQVVRDLDSLKDKKIDYLSLMIVKGGNQ